MVADAVLINRPAVDFAMFLGAAHDMLGYSPGANADASQRQLNDSERFLSCLAAMKDRAASVSLAPHLLAHVSFSMLLAADERDMQDVLMCCSGMPYVIADTIARGVQVTVVSGTLAQWRDAVVSGCQLPVDSARVLFNTILSRFEAENLMLWAGYARREAGHTFLLEDKR